jgi:Outer membrane protein beta-barrel domain
MRARLLVSAVLLAMGMSTATAVRASAQALQPQRSYFSPSPELGDFTLTNQPLFDPTEAQTRTARTQRDPELGFGFGVKLGPLFTTFNQNNVNFENRTGFIGGVFFGGNRPGLIGVQAEVLYAKKSAASGGVTTDLYYIQIPVLLRINIGTQSINKWAVYAVGGTALDIKLKGKQNDLDVSSNYESLDVDVVAGVGAEITRFIIEGRGMWGVRSVLKGDLANTQGDLKDKSFALLFGIRIN